MESARVGLFRVLPETMVLSWGVIAPMLEKAIEHNHQEMTLVDVADAIVSEKSQLWVAVQNDIPRGAFVTEIVNYPRKKVCRIVLLGGVSFEEWKHLLVDLENWALMNGCIDLDAYCRPGMAKKTKALGFEESAVVVTKSLRGRLQ